MVVAATDATVTCPVCRRPAGMGSALVAPQPVIRKVMPSAGGLDATARGAVWVTGRASLTRAMSVPGAWSTAIAATVGWRRLGDVRSFWPTVTVVGRGTGPL